MSDGAGRPGRLAGKVALVTGGTGGIGRAIVAEFVREGALVSFGGRDRAVAAEVVRSVDGAAEFLAFDVTDEAAVAEAVQRTVERHGRLDIMVNNAGTASPGSILDATSEQFSAAFDLNVRSVLFGTRYAALAMVERQAGSIVNIGSMAATRAFKDRALYCSSKAAMLQLTKVAALDLAPHGVRVNCVSPGATDTPLFRATRFPEGDPSPSLLNAFARQQLLGRMGTPSDTAWATVYLASDEAGWVTGANLVVDGGTTA
jgi:3alpha(or 20beta)-hydroxysteroid dehydrogenase